LQRGGQLIFHKIIASHSGGRDAVKKRWLSHFVRGYGKRRGRIKVRMEKAFSIRRIPSGFWGIF
jgi:hypothetical protein